MSLYIFCFGLFAIFCAYTLNMWLTSTFLLESEQQQLDALTNTVFYRAIRAFLSLFGL